MKSIRLILMAFVAILCTTNLNATDLVFDFEGASPVYGVLDGASPPTTTAVIEANPLQVAPNVSNNALKFTNPNLNWKGAKVQIPQDQRMTIEAFKDKYQKIAVKIYQATKPTNANAKIKLKVLTADWGASTTANEAGPSELEALSNPNLEGQWYEVEFDVSKLNITSGLTGKTVYGIAVEPTNGGGGAAQNYVCYLDDITLKEYPVPTVISEVDGKFTLTPDNGILRAGATKSGTDVTKLLSGSMRYMLEVTTPGYYSVTAEYKDAAIGKLKLKIGGNAISKNIQEMVSYPAAADYATNLLTYSVYLPVGTYEVNLQSSSDNMLLKNIVLEPVPVSAALNPGSNGVFTLTPTNIQMLIGGLSIENSPANFGSWASSVTGLIEDKGAGWFITIPATETYELSSELMAVQNGIMHIKIGETQLSCNYTASGAYGVQNFGETISLTAGTYPVEVKREATFNGWNYLNLRSIILTPSISTAIDSPEATELNVSMQDNLMTIKNLNAGDMISVYDMTGRSLANLQASHEQETISLNTSSVYIVKVVDGKGNVSVLKVR